MTLRHKGIHAAIQTMKLENSLMTRNFDEQTTSAALALIGQYGSDAEVIAVMRHSATQRRWLPGMTSSRVLRRLKLETSPLGRSSSPATAASCRFFSLQAFAAPAGYAGTEHRAARGSTELGRF